MKKIKILALVLVIVLAACSLYSCGKDGTVKEGDMKVNIIISSDEYGVLAEGVVGVDEGATVIDAMVTYCDREGIEYKLNAEMDTVEALGSYKEVVRNKLGYYWQYTLDGKEPKGRAGENTVTEGSKVVYNYTYIPTGDFVTVRFEAEGEVIVEDTVVVFDEGDSLLDSALDALKRSGLDYDKTADGNNLDYVDDYTTKVTPIYDEMWNVSVNDKAVEGNHDDTLAVSNDVIVFTFTRVEKELADTQA